MYEPSSQILNIIPNGTAFSQSRVNTNCLVIGNPVILDVKHLGSKHVFQQTVKVSELEERTKL